MLTRSRESSDDTIVRIRGSGRSRFRQSFRQSGACSVPVGIALVGVDAIRFDAEPYEGCALRSQVLPSSAASGVPDENFGHEGAAVRHRLPIPDHHARRLNRMGAGGNSARRERVEDTQKVSWLSIVKQDTDSRLFSS